MNKQEQYFLLEDYDPEGRCAMIKQKNREQKQVSYQLHFTDPIKENWKDAIEFEFAKPYPRRPIMADYHYWSSPKVFSNRIKETIESMNIPDIDFLDAEITNRKGETYNEYFIIHVRKLVACFDKEKSIWGPPAFDPNKVMSIEKMVLDMDKLEKIPLKERLIFRLEECVNYTLFHESVVDVIAELKPIATGFRFISVGAWGEDIGWELDD